MEIFIDDLKGEEIAKFLIEHHAEMLLHTPPESIHALDINELRSPDVTFWSAWINEDLAGCGALKELDSGHGEVKSMRTSQSYLRKGVAAAILDKILEEAKTRGYSYLSLETGSNEPFLPAQHLYKSFGFEYCDPFSDYIEDPYSVFMTRKV